VGEIVELCGLSGSGKSSLCHIVAASVARAYVEETPPKDRRAVVAHIDTGLNLSPSLLIKYLAGSSEGDSYLRVEGNAREALRCVRCVRALDVRSAMRGLLELSHDSKSSSDLKLIVVDTVSALFSSLLGGEKSLIVHATLAEFASSLKRFAHRVGAAVLVTNTTVAGRDAATRNALNVAGSRKPALGRTWKGIPSVRLWLERVHDAEAQAQSDAPLVVAKVMKSPRAPRGSQSERFALIADRTDAP